MTVTPSTGLLAASARCSASMRSKLERRMPMPDANLMRDSMITQQEAAQSAEHAPLTLHVPEPAVRPGGTPDFSNFRIPRAGLVGRPPIDAEAEIIRDLA